MIVLEAGQMCPHQIQCPYNTTKHGGVFLCQGANPARQNAFTCDHVGDNGKIAEGKIMRNPNDKTGKMKVIME